ncbi:MAG: alpha-N-acetylglucosaminidase TIM-barrel domain-containing protein [Planctomycetia bacterium]|nr:alpha-N-acetylglucosaminidase TIM-barrel domain-containing protein [Planctomycetia bacterium]
MFFRLGMMLFGIFVGMVVWGGELKILLPPNAEPAYEIAGKEFQKYYEQMTGKRLPMVAESNAEEEYVILGSDAVQPLVRELVERKVIADFPLKIASDDYRILSVKDGDRNHLILAGGRGRSTLYAVYDFLERQGCHWFWDGEVVPRKETISLEGWDAHESPQFTYRGLRYFAHRGLTRFQAEHWGLEDWEKEIDWILKKRLNLFMLRIGMDDVFQKAFPEIVPYPDPAKPIPEAMSGYDNRSLFWSLEYRGKLRKALLDYAFERDLMHPEDFGTMSHWYSRTPQAFLDTVKPEFLPQEGGAYGHPTDLVWDIRLDKNLENYWKLTQTHIEHYGKPELFHTIGVAERHCYKDREDNLRLKLYAYRRLIQNLRKHYPNAPLLLAGWDFYWGWKPEEVQEFVTQLSPYKTIVWDYEADAMGENNFTNWGVVGKFPYTFGIFLAYENALDIRANYPLLEERQKAILNDPYCQGYIFWPESSHTDIFLLHYFTENAWQAGKKSVEELLDDFCRQRYGHQAEKMKAIWQDVIPLSQLLHWGDNYGSQLLRSRADWSNANIWKTQANLQGPRLANAEAIFRRLAEIDWNDPFLRRDTIDLARTTADRLLTYARIATILSAHDYQAGKCDAATVAKKADTLVALAEGMRDILALHEDYSLYETWERCHAIEPIRNPNFGQVLLDNASCGYCRSHQYEVADRWYLPVIQEIARCVKDYATGEKSEKFTRPGDFFQKQTAFYNQMMQTPLPEMRPQLERTPENYRQTMLKMAENARFFN